MAEEERKKSDLKLQRRLAAEILGVGVNRIKILPGHEKEVQEAITREEIRILIHKGIIYADETKGQSRVRSRILHEKRKKGRRRGYGKRKGKKTARIKPKKMWIYKIRKMREYLKYLKDKNVIDTKTYRKLRQMAKGGFFRSLSHLRLYLEKEYISR